MLDTVIGQVEPAVNLALDAGQLPNPVVGQHEDGHNLLQHQRQEHLDEGDAVGHLHNDQLMGLHPSLAQLFPVSLG